MVYKTPEELFAAGQAFAQTLQGCESIALEGPMGAGKTLFAKGVCSALGVETQLVSSPTFSIICRYRGKFEIAHMDLYRLADEEEFAQIGGFDLLGRMLCLIEWPALILNELPAPVIRVALTVGEDGLRSLSVKTEARA